MQRATAIAVTIVVLIAAIAVYMLVGRDAPAPEPVAEPEPAAPASEAEEVAPPEIVLPPLAESDALVLGLAADLGVSPGMIAALRVDVVRTFVKAVDAVASGETPRQQLAFLAPEGDFPTVQRDGLFFADASGFARYDTAAAEVAALDAESLVSGFETIEPLANEAFVEIGGAEIGFRRRLIQALDVLLAAPQIEGEPRLLDVAVDRFEYAEPQLEDLPPVQKQLLRMGPRNQALIQRKLQQIRDLLAGA